MGYDWVNDFGGSASQALTDVGTYISENEWVADLATGAAVAGLGYLAAEEERDFRREENDRAYDRKVDMASAGEVSMGQYDWSNLAQNNVMGGGLISEASN